MLVNQALSRRTRDIFHAFDENREAGFFLINARTSAWIIQSRRGRSRVTEYSQVRVDASPTIRPFFFLSALKPLDSPFFSLLLSILSRKSCELFFLFFFFTNNFDDGYGSEIHLSLFEKLKVYDTIFFLSFFFFFRSLFYLELKSHEISISRILSVQWLGLLSFSNIYPWNTWSVRCLYWNETGGRSMRLRMGWKYTVHGV